MWERAAIRPSLGFGTLRACPERSRMGPSHIQESDVEPKENYVAVAYDIVFSFHAELTRFTGFR